MTLDPSVQSLNYSTHSRTESSSSKKTYMFRSLPRQWTGNEYPLLKELKKQQQFKFLFIWIFFKALSLMQLNCQLLVEHHRPTFLWSNLMYFLCVHLYSPISIISPNRIVIKKKPQKIWLHTKKRGASCRDFNAPKGDLVKRKKNGFWQFLCCCSKEEEEEAVHNPIKWKKKKKKG